MRSVVSAALLALTSLLVIGCAHLNTHIRGSSHHYTFAHQYLPNRFYNDGRNLVEQLRRGGRKELHRMWVEAGKSSKSPRSIRPQDLTFKILGKDDELQIVFIEFPQPSEAPEAYFAAMIFLLGQAIDYQTLEKTLNLGANSPSTISCGWKKDGHYNGGFGFPPNYLIFQNMTLELILKDMGIDPNQIKPDTI